MIDRGGGGGGPPPPPPPPPPPRADFSSYRSAKSNSSSDHAHQAVNGESRSRKGESLVL